MFAVKNLWVELFQATSSVFVITHQQFFLKTDKTTGIWAILNDKILYNEKKFAGLYSVDAQFLPEFQDLFHFDVDTLNINFELHNINLLFFSRR